MAVLLLAVFIVASLWLAFGGTPAWAVDEGTGGTPTAPSPTTTAPATTAGFFLQPPAPDFPGLTPGAHFSSATVQFLPEYDSQDVLVIVDYQLPADATVPFTFRFRLPTGARPTGYALVDANGAFDYDRPVPQVIPGSGAWDTIEVVVPRNQPAHIEYYYDPGVSTAGTRDFPLIFEAPGAIDRLNLSVQQPARATGFTLTPPLSTQAQDGYGLTAATGSVNGVEAGETAQLRVTYEKPDANPSASGETPAVAAGGDAAVPAGAGGTSAGTDYVLWLLGALVVGVAALAAYRLLGTRAAPDGVPPDDATVLDAIIPGAAVIPGAAEYGDDETLPPAETAPAGTPAFCTACGTPYGEDDRFCTACGETRDG